MNKRIETLGKSHFLLGACLNLILKCSNAAELGFGLDSEFGAPLISPAVEPSKEGLATWIKVKAYLFDLPVECTYLSKKGVGLRGNHVQTVDKIVHVAHPPRNPTNQII